MKEPEQIFHSNLGINNNNFNISITTGSVKEKQDISKHKGSMKLAKKQVDSNQELSIDLSMQRDYYQHSPLVSNSGLYSPSLLLLALPNSIYDIHQAKFQNQTINYMNIDSLSQQRNSIRNKSPKSKIKNSDKHANKRLSMPPLPTQKDLHINRKQSIKHLQSQEMNKYPKQMDQQTIFELNQLPKIKTVSNTNSINKTKKQIQSAIQKELNKALNSNSRESENKQDALVGIGKQSNEQIVDPLSNNQQTWIENFNMIPIKNYVKRNRQNLTAQNKQSLSPQIQEASQPDKIKNSLILNSTIKQSPLEIEKQKLEKERIKIKNIIGNNPFRVKNYVQGNKLNNNLIPLQLLNQKDLKFKDDDEFISHYLQQKKKEDIVDKERQKRYAAQKTEELKIAESKYKLQKDKQLLDEELMKLDINSPDYQSRMKAIDLKVKLTELIDQKQKEEQKQAEYLKSIDKVHIMKTQLRNALLLRVAVKVKEIEIQKQEQAYVDRIKAKNDKIINKLKKQEKKEVESDEDQLNKNQSMNYTKINEIEKNLQMKEYQKYKQESLIFGDFKKQIEQQKISQRILNTMDEGVNLLRQESSIQQLVGVHDIDGQITHEASLQNLNFAPQVQSIQQIKQMNQSNEYQINKHQFLDQSQNSQKNIYNSFQQHPTYDSNQFDKWGSQFLTQEKEHLKIQQSSGYLPHQIQKFLSKKHLNSITNQTEDISNEQFFKNQEEFNNFVSKQKQQIQDVQLKTKMTQQHDDIIRQNSVTILNSRGNEDTLKNLKQYDKVNNQQAEGKHQIEIQSLIQLSPIKSQKMDSSNNQQTSSQSQIPFEPFVKLVNSKFYKDFVPGSTKQGHGLKGNNIQQIHQIIQEAKKKQNDHKGLRDLASLFQQKIKTDRSPINSTGRQDGLYSNFKFFEREFQLRKFQIEDYYLKRQAEKTKPFQIQSNSNSDALIGNDLQDANYQNFKKINSIQRIKRDDTVEQNQFENILIDQSDEQNFKYNKQNSNDSDEKDFKQDEGVLKFEKINKQIQQQKKDIIHVTLDAASIRQLIKLCQDLIPDDQIEAEIERQIITQESNFAQQQDVLDGAPSEKIIKNQDNQSTQVADFDIETIKTKKNDLTKSYELENSLANKNSINEKSMNLTPNVNQIDEMMPFPTDEILSPYQNQQNQTNSHNQQQLQNPFEIILSQTENQFQLNQKFLNNNQIPISDKFKHVIDQANITQLNMRESVSQQKEQNNEKGSTQHPFKINNTINNFTQSQHKTGHFKSLEQMTSVESNVYEIDGDTFSPTNQKMHQFFQQQNIMQNQQETNPNMKMMMTVGSTIDKISNQSMNITSQQESINQQSVYPNQLQIIQDNQIHSSSFQLQNKKIKHPQFTKIQDAQNSKEQIELLNQQTLVNENKLKVMYNKKGKNITSADEFQIFQQEMEKQMNQLRFRNADSKQLIVNRNAKLKKEIQSYIKEQQRKKQNQEQAEIGFRLIANKIRNSSDSRENLSPQQQSANIEYMSKVKSLNKIDFDNNQDTEQLLNQVNYYILGTQKRMIQSKIQQLLNGTELNNIASKAEIIIHIQNDAKLFLSDFIQQQQEIKQNTYLQKNTQRKILIFKNKNNPVPNNQSEKIKNGVKVNGNNLKAGSSLSYENKNGYKIGITQINYHTSSNSSDNEQQIQGIRGFAIKNEFSSDTFQQMPLNFVNQASSTIKPAPQKGILNIQTKPILQTKQLSPKQSSNQNQKSFLLHKKQSEPVQIAKDQSKKQLMEEKNFALMVGVMDDNTENLSAVGIDRDQQQNQDILGVITSLSLRKDDPQSRQQ